MDNHSLRSKIQTFRGIAILAVIMIHTLPDGQWQIYIKPFLNFAVATFIFLSGYLTKVDNDRLMAFYHKRIMRVLVPYVLWTVIYSLQDVHNASLISLAKNLISANASTQLYYIFVYIQFVLLTPLISKLAKSRYRFIGWLIAPLSVIAFKYIPVFGHFPIDKHLQLLWSDACLGWFTFYYLGMMAGNRIIKHSYKLSNLAIIYSASLLLQIGEGYIWSLYDPAGCGTQLKLTALLSSTIFLLIICQILNDNSHQLQCKTLETIGNYSFGIYLSHMMIIETLESLQPDSYIPFPVSFMIVLLLSLSFCFICTHALGKKAAHVLGFI